MPFLQNYPMVGQIDGSINEQMDCVAASVASALQYLTKRRYTSVETNNAVYGTSYVGVTDPAKYVNYAKQQGVSMSAIAGNNNELIQSTQKYIKQGKPVLLTIADPYAPASLGLTHVVACYGSTDTALVVMDPYIDTSTTKSIQEWSSILRYGVVWVLERKEENIVLSIQQAEQFFTEIQKDEVWQCKQNGYRISHGILLYYR